MVRQGIEVLIFGGADNLSDHVRRMRQRDRLTS